MRFGVLGPLRAQRADATPVAVAGPARRQVLAALLARAGSSVTAAALIDDLWGTDVPRTALKTLRSHVARLRDDLGRSDESVLTTEGNSYRLVLGPDDLDAVVFARMVGTAAQNPDPDAALGQYDEALALWRGEAYADFGEAPFAVAERIRLSELRAVARERRTDLALSLGHAADLVAELQHRVRAEPYRERGWEQLAVALYRAGRQADALAACRRARRLLADELGVDPGPALRDVETQILQQDAILLADHQPATALVDRCPYLGLGGYDESDSALFVGRERLTAVLAGRLADQSVVVVTGASGVGKSSLVRAGLLPALRAGALPGSAAWSTEVCTPVTFDAAAQRRPDLLVVDQAEEMFISLDDPARAELVDRLARHVDDDGRLLVVLRSDFYGRLVDIDGVVLPFTAKSALLVGPLREDELRRALIEPARAAGVHLEDELVETVMEDVAGQPEPLPLLSEAMVRTWRWRERNLLTLAGYRRSGEVAGALEAAAEDCFEQLTPDQRAACRHLLVRMAVHTDAGWVSRPLFDPGALDSTQREVLDALITARLVVASDTAVELTHDALLRHWPRLREWLEERDVAADLLRHLDRAAIDWNTAGRSSADLYRGPRLNAALDWQSEHPEDVSALEAAFLADSARAARTELDEARTRAAAEARGRRRLRRVAIALAAVVVLAVAGGVVAVVERHSANQAADRAQSAALTADARRLAALSENSADLATSSLLAVAAVRLQDSPDTRGALLDAVERNQSALWRVQFPQRPQRVFATPDGAHIAVNDNRTYAYLVDPRHRRTTASFPVIGFLAGMTADARQLVAYGPTASAAPTGRLEVYDVASGRGHVVSDAGDPDAFAVMSPDGRWVAMPTLRRAGRGTVIDVFDSRDWSTPPRRFASEAVAADVEIADGALAVEHPDGSVEVRALPSLHVVHRLPAVGGGQPGVAITARGAEVARLDPAAPERVRLYGAGQPPSGTALPIQSSDVQAMSFSPDGAELAVGTSSGALGLYSARDGSQVAQFAGHNGPLHSIAWTGTSRATGLYTIGLDGQLVSWDLSTRPRTVQQVGAALLATERAERYGPLIVGDAQPDGQPNSRRRLYSIDIGSGRYTSWRAGLADDGGIGQVVASWDRRYLLDSTGAPAGPSGLRSRIDIVDLHTHDTIGHLVLPPGTAGFIDGLNAAVSPDGRYAYCSLGRDRVGVFALPSGRYLRSFHVDFAGPGSGRIEAVPWQFDPNGHLVVAGTDPGPDGGEPWIADTPRSPPDQRLGLVDPATGRLVAQVGLGDTQGPTALAWSRDGRTLAVGTYAGTLTLHDAATLRIEARGGVVESGPVRSVSFAPDGRSLVTGGFTLKFWSVPGLTPEGHGIVIAGSANSAGVWAWFRADGVLVGLAPADPTGSSDRQRWFVFDARPAHLIALACHLAGAPMTRAQWLRYVGDRPYRPVCG